MNKTELIDKIAAGAEITKAQAKAALEATTNALKEALIAGDHHNSSISRYVSM